MTAHQIRFFLNRFIQQLEPGPTWLHPDPDCALWLDGLGRLNSLCVQAYALDGPLARIVINKTPSAALRSRDNWPEAPRPARPDWRLELVCATDQLDELAGWIAAVVNRREGFLARLPAPPAPLLNWEDLGRLDDHLYYLSAITLWTERAFLEDVHRNHSRASVLPAAGRGFAPVVAH